MRNPIIQKFQDKPDTFIDLGTGDWYYNYNINQCAMTVFSNIESTEVFSETPGYEFIQVRISGRPTYEKCVRAIIREYVTMDEEFDLINSYNRDNSNEEYKEYLKLLEEIKSKVRKDFD